LKTFSNLILSLGVHSLQISIFTNNVFYFIAEVETEGIDESRLSISQTSSDDDPLSNKEWTVEYQKEVDTDKELEQTQNDRLEGNIGVNRTNSKSVYYFRAFFDLALKYTFVLTLKSVGFLELF